MGGGTTEGTAFGTHSNPANKGPVKEIVCRIVVLLISYFWFCTTTTLLFFVRFFDRIGGKDTAQKGDDNFPWAGEQKTETDVFGEKETCRFGFKSRFQIPEDNSNIESKGEQGISSGEENTMSPTTTNVSKYRFLSENDSSGFVEEHEAVSFLVRESHVVDTDGVVLNNRDKFDTEHKTRFSPVRELRQFDSDGGAVRRGGDLSGYVVETEAVSFCGFDSDPESDSVSDGYSVRNLIADSDSDGFLSEGDFEPENGRATTSDLAGEKEELLEDRGELEGTHLRNMYNSGIGISSDFLGQIAGSPEDIQKPKKIHCKDLYSSDAEFNLNSSQVEVSSGKDPHGAEHESDISGAEVSRICKFDETQLPNSSTEEEEEPVKTSGTLNLHDSKNSDSLLSPVDELRCKSPGSSDREANPVQEEDIRKPEETHLDEAGDLSVDGEEELECLGKHQDLIEQLRMELRKVRAIGLPTILEESESPKSIEDLKPWKMDAKFLQEDPMDDLHELYGCYRERMRKLDILNYQKMYETGFLQLKDPLQSTGSQKTLIPTITSLLPRNIRPCRRRRSGGEPSVVKFIKELKGDLETVYVGQSCLSWEFLRWQYEKARSLPESDLYGCRRYDRVAREFLQFQVVVQRFLENEPFQGGTRVQNYVKNRCVLRNLLQVPVIEEDCLEDKMEERRKGKDAITIEMLGDIMEESIRTFWEFVKSDKDETPLIIVKGLVGNHSGLEDPTDFRLMVDLQAGLQKREKKLKDMLRTGKYLVKKFKKPREWMSMQDNLFFSLVDLKLVSRVLKTSRITSDQLVWCHNKLSKITFVERKLLREPSFLLFPC